LILKLVQRAEAAEQVLPVLLVTFRAVLLALVIRLLILKRAHFVPTVEQHTTAELDIIKQVLPVLEVPRIPKLVQLVEQVVLFIIVVVVPT